LQQLVIAGCGIKRGENTLQASRLNVMFKSMWVVLPKDRIVPILLPVSG